MLNFIELFGKKIIFLFIQGIKKQDYNDLNRLTPPSF